MHRDKGMIGTTGPEMRRFFFSVNEAATLVETALMHSEELWGSVLSRPMKAARIGDVLAAWIQLWGGCWERIAGRPGEREDEFLVGEQEAPFARRLRLEGGPHYQITPNRRQDGGLEGSVSSANSERMDRDELLDLLRSRPTTEE